MEMSLMTMQISKARMRTQTSHHVARARVPDDLVGVVFGGQLSLWADGICAGVVGDFPGDGGDIDSGDQQALALVAKREA
jgi:hypothetical protein